MFSYKNRYGILSKVIATVLVCLFLSNDIIIAQPSISTLATLPASQNPIVKREITAAMYRASRLIWLANSPRYLDLLDRYNALVLLLPSGRYLMAPETAANDLAIIRAATHEDNEILMQQEEKLRPMRYNRLMQQILGRSDIMKLYRTLSHYKEPNKQPDNITFNDLIAKAFEILFVIDEGLVYPDELTSQEREFIVLMRPILEAKDSIGRYKNFSQVFFDTDKRTKAIKTLQEDKDERFYRVANTEEAAAGDALNTEAQNKNPDIRSPMVSTTNRLTLDNLLLALRQNRVVLINKVVDRYCIIFILTIQNGEITERYNVTFFSTDEPSVWKRVDISTPSQTVEPVNITKENQAIFDETFRHISMLQKSAKTKQKETWRVDERSRNETSPIQNVITDLEKGWGKVDSLDLASLPVGTLVYLGDTGQSINQDGHSEGEPIWYLIRIEENNHIKLWFSGRSGSFLGSAGLLRSDSGKTSIPGRINANENVTFPYFWWQSGEGLLPLDRAPRERAWYQKFPFFRVLYSGSMLPTEEDEQKIKKTDMQGTNNVSLVTSVNEVQQAFSALNSETRKVSQLGSSVSKLRGTSQNLMEVNKFKFCLPIEALRNSPDIALALNSTGLLKQKPQDAENIEFELVVTGVMEEDVKLIEGLKRDDIKKALNLPKKFTVSIITEAQIQETAQRFGYDASNPKNRVAIVKDVFSGALAKGEYMAIATDALDTTEKADALKEELERELKSELVEENISIRILVRPESGKSMYSLSKILNDWLEAINQGNYSTISRILPIPAPLTPELANIMKALWVVLAAA